MKIIAIDKPRFNYLLVQALASKYHVRETLAGHKVVLRSCQSEDLVRIMSAIKILERY